MINQLKNNAIVIAILLLSLMATCNNNSSVSSLKKEVIRQEHKNDSLNAILVNQMQIEGLKSEKRMIQSTDRKMLDVTRMSEIDKELKSINGGK
jgi:mannitol-specific phosphotransferase system IIBC component